MSTRNRENLCCFFCTGLTLIAITSQNQQSLRFQYLTLFFPTNNLFMPSDESDFSISYLFWLHFLALSQGIGDFMAMLAVLDPGFSGEWSTEYYRMWLILSSWKCYHEIERDECFVWQNISPLGYWVISWYTYLKLYFHQLFYKILFTY